MTQEDKSQAIFDDVQAKGLKKVGVNFIFVNGILSTNFIFSHDFLKAFFGEKPYHHRQLEIDVHPFHRDEFAPIEVPKWFNWQYHAQQLAITPEEERIDYLYNFL